MCKYITQICLITDHEKTSQKLAIIMNIVTDFESNGKMYRTIHRSVARALADNNQVRNYTWIERFKNR